MNNMEKRSKKNSKKSEGKEGEGPGESSKGKNKSGTKKNLTFLLPEDESQESFASALSNITLGVECADDDDDDDDSETNLPQLFMTNGQYIFNPRFYAQPRQASARSCKVSEKYLLEDTPSLLLNEISRDSPTPSDENIHLFRAIYQRKLSVVKGLIKNGANVNIMSGGESPLLIATELGDSNVVSYLLTLPGININEKNKFGQAALSVAVRNSFEEIVSLLLNVKADVNTQDNLGRTPLHNALFQEKKRMVYRLLAFNANVDLEDCFGERAIYTCAVKKPNLECLKALLREGASTNYLNFSKVPLLSRAIMNGTEFSIIETLVEFGASVNLQDLALRTPLHYAALSNHLRAAKLLVDNGADITLKNSKNLTAFDQAKAQCCRDVEKYLQSLQPYVVMNRQSLMKEKKKNSKGRKYLSLVQL